MWYNVVVNQLVKVFHALSDETRFRILCCLFACKDKDLCVCELADCLRLKLSTLSSHLNILKNAGLASIRKDGTWVYYRVGDSIPNFVIEAIKSGEVAEEDSKRLDRRLSLRVDNRCCIPVGALDSEKITKEAYCGP